MTFDRGRIATSALRVVAIVLFVVSQARSDPGFGVSGVGLTVALLSGGLILALSLAIFPTDWTRLRLADLLPWPTLPPPPAPEVRRAAPEAGHATPAPTPEARRASLPPASDARRAAREAGPTPLPAPEVGRATPGRTSEARRATPPPTPEARRASPPSTSEVRRAAPPSAPDARHTTPGPTSEARHTSSPPASGVRRAAPPSAPDARHTTPGPTSEARHTSSPPASEVGRGISSTVGGHGAGSARNTGGRAGSPYPLDLEPWWAVAVRAVGELPVKAVLLAVAVVLSLALDSVAQGGPALAAMFITVGTAASRLPLTASVPVGVVAVVGLLVSGAWAGQVNRDLSMILAVGIVFLVAYSVRERRALRVAEGREAVLAERARIAREIHDVLAHSLSAQIVHLEGAKLLLRADRADEALDRVIRARDLAKSGLEEARRAVSALREDLPGLPVALTSLANDFEDATGLPCHLTITGHERRITPQTELAMTRTAQEALTNIRRHAPGAPATVHLAFTPTTCIVDITNPLPQPPPPTEPNPKPSHPTEPNPEPPRLTEPNPGFRTTTHLDQEPPTTTPDPDPPTTIHLDQISPSTTSTAADRETPDTTGTERGALGIAETERGETAGERQERPAPGMPGIADPAGKQPEAEREIPPTIRLEQGPPSTAPTAAEHETPTSVRLEQGPSSATVTAERGGGYGLVGMRERAELLGGRLTAGESDGVFHVNLQVPA